jgi:hypothetical protein
MYGMYCMYRSMQALASTVEALKILHGARTVYNAQLKTTIFDFVAPCCNRNARQCHSNDTTSTVIF